MRNILAITLALMIAAVSLMPIMGYTIKSDGNQSYTLESGPRVNYSIVSGIVAHNLTQEMITAKVAILPSVTATRVPYSIKLEKAIAAMAPSVTIPGKEVAPVAPPVVKTAPVVPPVVETAPVEPVANETAPVEPVVSETVVEPVANETVPVEPVVSETVVEPVANETAPVEPVVSETAGMLSIQGMVTDENNTGLADWTVVLENPDGTMTNTTTVLEGTYAFNDLIPGEYIVSEELKDGWELVSPIENQISINLTESITGQNFVNKMVQVSENATATTTA